MKKITFISLTLLYTLICITYSNAQKPVSDLYKSLLTSHDSLKSGIYCDLAYIYLDSAGNKSVMFSEKALHYAKKFNNKNDIVFAHIMTGSSYLEKGDYSKSLDAFNTALEISKKSKNYYQLHTITNNIGIVYKYTGEYDLALEYYSIALNYAKQCNDLQSIVQSLTNTGNIYVIKEEYDTGLKYYEAAINECSKQDTFMIDIPSIYNNIGYIRFTEQKYDLARVSYEKAYQIFDSLNNTYGKAVLLNNLAEIEVVTGDLEKAEALINTADSLHKLMDFDDSRMNLYLTSYQMFLEQENYYKALEYLNKYDSLKDSIYTKELDEKVKDIKTKYEVDKVNAQSRAKDEKIKQKNITNALLTVVILVISCLIILLFRQIKHKSKLNNLLIQSNDSLKQKDDEIESNLLYARLIQESCMFNKQEKIAYDYFVLDLPKFTVGGDFYMIRKVAEKTVFILADSTGHGISAGFLSVLGIEIIDNILIQNKHLDSILNNLNNKYFEYITKSDTLRGESLSISIISIENDMVSYAGSKHKIWKYSKETNEIEEMKTNSDIIGYNKDLHFTEKSIKVSAGDYIFLSSDGYPDQFGSESKIKMKYNLFRNHLKACAAMQTAESKEYLKAKFLEWKSDNEQTDDILVIGIKF